MALGRRLGQGAAIASQFFRAESRVGHARSRLAAALRQALPVGRRGLNPKPWDCDCRGHACPCFATLGGRWSKTKSRMHACRLTARAPVGPFLPLPILFPSLPFTVFSSPALPVPLSLPHWLFPPPIFHFFVFLPSPSHRALSSIFPCVLFSLPHSLPSLPPLLPSLSPPPLSLSLTPPLFLPWFQEISDATDVSGTWCSGITPAQHAGGPGLNPQCVHLY